MLLSLVQTTSTSSSSSSSSPWLPFSSNYFNIPSYSTLLPKTLFPETSNGLRAFLLHSSRRSHGSTLRGGRKPCSLTISTIQASLLESPVIWAGRVCIFYALLKAGLAGSQANPLVSDLERSDGDGGNGESSDMGFSKWLNSIQGKPVKEAADRRKLVSKWHPTTKGTLKRNYRVPSKSEGRRLLKAIASLLSDDDHFVDATSHKGCQIRRESAHGESVCCNNVRALFDELPTPHLIVEITPFPAGPLTEKDYTKAEKLERVLRTGPSV
ncbi:6,7-dimethyl-8-ribityllumazine synthase [Trema orientale]|uniref:6,7-dimethyl-8-ribityllumazine synthase n=1 Tax=Trema orientale TaxID=63057 RepID=A0A2P5EZJ2_TREOI|nr:6,7-dimethyl-8-ribityllumazine synthase [Trema orientale]